MSNPFMGPASLLPIPSKPKKRGRGRPPLPPGERLNRYSVMMTDDMHVQLAAIGDGNVSKGLRVAVEKYLKTKKGK